MDFLRAMCYRMHTPYAGAQEGGKHERTCEAFKEKKTGFHRLWMSATLALMT